MQHQVTVAGRVIEVPIYGHEVTQDGNLQVLPIEHRYEQRHDVVAHLVVFDTLENRADVVEQQLGPITVLDLVCLLELLEDVLDELALKCHHGEVFHKLACELLILEHYLSHPTYVVNPNPELIDILALEYAHELPPVVRPPE